MPGSVTGAGQRVENKIDNILAFMGIIFYWRE